MQASLEPTLAYSDTYLITAVKCFIVQAPSKPFYPSLIFENKAGTYPSEALLGAPFKGRFLALPEKY